MEKEPVIVHRSACNENKYHENFQIRDLPSRNENLNPRNIATIR